MATPGFPLVLTADQTLMSQHRLLLDGMLAASQTTTSPVPLLRRLLLPGAPHPDGQALLAPLGLRRVEAALRAGGFGAEEIAVADQAHLPGVIGPQTRLVALATGEPLGLGMSSSTMVGVVGGRIWPQALFEAVLREVRRLIKATGSPAKIVVGGPGSWQLAADEKRRRALGVDHVVTGYCEGNVAELLRGLLDGAALPAVLTGQPPAAADIPRILRPATMGAVELSRGCGLGCEFCTLARVPMGHLSPDTICADAETNLASGNANLCLLSEDFLRYGGQGVNCRPEALLDLARRLRSLTTGLLQVDHCNVASVARYSDEQLQELHDLLAGVPEGLVWVNIGIESASGAMVERLGGRAKMAGVPAAEWGEFCATQLRRLCAARFLPLASLVLGAPQETRADLEQTLAWVRTLADQRLTIFPVLYAPVDGSPPPTRASLSKLHWQIIRECYALNFRHMPGLYWDNQTRGRVPRGKCVLFQVIGHGQVAQWKSLLWLHQRRART